MLVETYHLVIIGESYWDEVMKNFSKVFWFLLAEGEVYLQAGGLRGHIKAVTWNHVHIETGDNMQEGRFRSWRKRRRRLLKGRK